MHFRIGETQAHCPSCKGTEFDFEDGAKERRPATFRCRRCGAGATYSELLDQVTASVSRQAAEMLRRLKKD